MDGAGPGWVPPRPGRPVATQALPPSRFEVEGERLLSRSRPVGAARRRSPALRIALAYLAGAAVTGLVVGAGAVVQPVYGSEPAFGGTAFAEVRSTPTAAGWSLPLASEFAPGVPPACVTFRAGAVDEHHELLTADLPSPSSTGQNAECEVSSPETRGRLVMVDPATGRVQWRRSLEHDLGTTVFSLVWHASASAEVVVVGVDGSKGDELLALDVRSGRTVSEVTVDDPDAVINFAVSGHLVVSAVPGTGGTVTTYTLRRTTDLDTDLWTRSISSVLLPQLLPDRFVVPLPEGTVSIDGSTGDQTPWGSDLRNLEGVRVTGDRVVAQTIPRGVGLAASVVMLDARGRTLWSRPSPAISGLSVARRCVVVSTDVVRVTCLDPASGAERWSSEIPGSVVGTPDGATTGDVESIGPVRARDRSLTLSELDGDTGHVRFQTSIPRGSDVVGQAAATGYALGTRSSDGASVLTAFDLDSGRTLWTLGRSELGVWGGHLVEITRAGVARELVGGRSGTRHDMLVG